jgi:ferredoxin-NADP reductase
VLVFRLGLPGWRSAYHRLRVLAVVPEAPGVVSVLIRGHRLDRLPARAGQFFLWRFLDGPGWTRANPYSLSAQPSRDQLRLTVQAVGDGSNRVSRLKPGTRVLIEGPYGALTSERRRNRRVLLIAAGVGITPMRALLEEFTTTTARRRCSTGSPSRTVRCSPTSSPTSPRAAVCGCTTWPGPGAARRPGCPPGPEPN